MDNITKYHAEVEEQLSCCAYVKITKNFYSLCVQEVYLKQFMIKDGKTSLAESWTWSESSIKT